MKIRYRVLLVLVAVTVVTSGMVAAWYGWQDYQGNRQWEETRRDLEARGEELTLAPFIPPPVPDGQNLAFAPLFVRLYQYKVDPKTGLTTFNPEGNNHAFETVNTIPYGKGGDPFPVKLAFQPWMIGHALDLAKYQKYFRGREDFPHTPQPQTAAEDVRLALTRFGPLLDELAQAAAKRPLERFPANWTQQPASEIALPQDNLVQKLVITLKLRASVSLALGRTDDALHDIILGLRLRQAVASEPTSIASLVDDVCLLSLLQPVWEGLAERRWSTPQIAQLQVQFSQMDLIRNFQRSARAERASIMIPFVDDLERSRNLNQLQRFQQITTGGEDDNSIYRWMSLILPIFPKGWFAEAKAVACRMDQQIVIDLVQPGSHRVLARRSEDGVVAFHRLPMLPSTLIVKLFLPIGTSVVAKVAQTQAFVDEAKVACALERYFLAHQVYPDKLDALVPEVLDHLPTDVVDGTPIRYRRTQEGRYRLWEVGWNGTDEGGTVAWENGTTWIDFKQGDWVWQYEAMQSKANPDAGR